MAKSTKITKGVYQDQYGIFIRIPLGERGKSRDVRKNAAGKKYSDFTLGELRDERLRLMAAALDEEEKTALADGSLAADVKVFANTFKSTGRKRDVQSLLAHWIAVFGDRDRHSLKTVELETQLAKWAPRKPPATLKQLRQVLGQLYRKLDGKTARNPIADCAAIAVHYDAPRAIPYTLIEAILAQMGTSQSAARARVMAYTGLPQAQLKRLDPTHVDLDAEDMQVKARRKGGGAPAKTLPLVFAEAIPAFRTFHQRDCWGTFSDSTFAREWRNAVRQTKADWKKQRRTWPVDFTPRAYDLRHSFATEYLKRTNGDYHGLNEMLQHATMNQTLRYGQGAVSPRLLQAKAAFRATPTPTPTPHSPTPTPTPVSAKHPKRSTFVQSNWKPRLVKTVRIAEGK